MEIWFLVFCGGLMILMNAAWKLLSGSGKANDLARGAAGDALKKWLK